MAEASMEASSGPRVLESQPLIASPFQRPSIAGLLSFWSHG